MSETQATSGGLSDKGQFLNKSYTVTENLDNQAITINRDRLRLFIIKYLEKLKERQDWMTPAGIFISISAALFTSDFRATFGIPAVYLRTAFVLIDLVAAYFFIRRGWRAVRGKSVEDLVRCICRGDEP